MAKEFNISSQSYRLKEKGQVNFNKNEMIKFRDLLRENLFPNITIDEIFFNYITMFNYVLGDLNESTIYFK